MDNLTHLFTQHMTLVDAPKIDVFWGTTDRVELGTNLNGEVYLYNHTRNEYTRFNEGVEYVGFCGPLGKFKRLINNPIVGYKIADQIYHPDDVTIIRRGDPHV